MLRPQPIPEMPGLVRTLSNASTVAPTLVLNPESTASAITLVPEIPARTIPARTVPAQTVPARTVPARARMAPARTTPARTIPMRTTEDLHSGLTNAEGLRGTIILPATEDHGEIRLGYSDTGRHRLRHLDRDGHDIGKTILLIPGREDARVVAWTNARFARDRKVRLLVVDRFGTGESSAVDAEQEAYIWLEMVVKLLRKVKVRHVALISTDIGCIYLMRTLLYCRHILDDARPFAAMLDPPVLELNKSRRRSTISTIRKAVHDIYVKDLKPQLHRLTSKVQNRPTIDGVFGQVNPQDEAGDAQDRLPSGVWVTDKEYREFFEHLTFTERLHPASSPTLNLVIRTNGETKEVKKRDLKCLTRCLKGLGFEVKSNNRPRGKAQPTSRVFIEEVIQDIIGWQ